MKVKYFTKSQLVRAAKEGMRRGFSRQLDAGQLRALPNLRFPITGSWSGEMIGGSPLYPFVRCMVFVSSNKTGEGGQPTLIDVTPERLASLDEAEVRSPSAAHPADVDSGMPL